MPKYKLLLSLNVITVIAIAGVTSNAAAKPAGVALNALHAEAPAPAKNKSVGWKW